MLKSCNRRHPHRVQTTHSLSTSLWMPRTCHSFLTLGTPESHLLDFPLFIMCSPLGRHLPSHVTQRPMVPNPSSLVCCPVGCLATHISTPMSRRHVHPPCPICTPHPHSRLLSFSGVPYLGKSSLTSAPWEASWTRPYSFLPISNQQAVC